jgi:hypothetical protein
MIDDTIAAIATPLGEGGLAVIRISGPHALDIVDKCFHPVGKSSRRAAKADTHTIHYGRISRSGQTVDEVLIAVMRAPRTFTREDIVEVTCHGGLLPAKAVLDTILENGARLALPGEFTKRAFLNGRIDLAQAEAVTDIIHSRTELALAAANEQLAGKLSQRINKLRDDLVATLAHIERTSTSRTKTSRPIPKTSCSHASNTAWRSSMNCSAPQTKDRYCAVEYAPRSLAARTRASPACSTNSWRATAPSSRPYRERRATQSRRPQTFAASPWFLSTPPGFAKRAMKSRSKASSAAINRSRKPS